MAFNKTKRKRIEALVAGTFSALDRTGRNADRYAAFFGAMDDAKFERWARALFADEDENFFLECTPYATEPSMADIRKAARFLKLPLEERVTFRHLGGIMTRDPVPVGLAA